MRRIGTLPDEEQARLFSNFLTANGCENEIDVGSAGVTIWVLDEDRLEAAKADLEEFRADPGNKRFVARAREARSVQRDQEKVEKRREKLYVDVRTEQAKRALREGRVGPLTAFLIGICVYVAFITGLGDTEQKGAIVDDFLIEPVYSKPEGPYVFIGLLEIPVEDWPEVIPQIPGMLTAITEQGQWWRLLAPIFLHFGIVHILFNMMWLKDLGSLIEHRRGWFFLLMLIVVSGVISCFLQFCMSGPAAGGFSGVIYAMFGYVWMKSKFFPEEGWSLNPQVVQLMVIWLFVCMTGWLGPIGNTAHATGLIVGMIIGAGGRLLRSR